MSVNKNVPIHKECMAEIDKVTHVCVCVCVCVCARVCDCILENRPFSHIS